MFLPPPAEPVSVFLFSPPLPTPLPPPSHHQPDHAKPIKLWINIANTAFTAPRILARSLFVMKLVFCLPTKISVLVGGVKCRISSVSTGTRTGGLQLKTIHHKVCSVTKAFVQTFSWPQQLI